MRRVAIFLSVACCVGAALAEQPSKELIARAKAHITRNLLDPYSAVLENLYVTKAKGDGSTVLCGTVNAKNSFGAYIGRKAFYYSDNKKEPAGAIEGDMPLGMLVATICAR